MTERPCENCHHRPAEHRCPCGCIIMVCAGCHQTIGDIQTRMKRLFTQ